MPKGRCKLFSPRVAFCLLLAVTGALYAPTVQYPFLYEDMNDIQALTKPFQVSDLWRKPARSLTSLSYAVSDARSPLTPTAYHADNVILHLVNVGLVFVLLAQTWPALFGAAVFALHPMQTESVAYISSRADLIATMGVLLALIALERRQWWAVLVASVCAVLGKETAIVVAVLVPLYAHWRRIVLPTWLLALWAFGTVAGVGYFAVRYAVTASPVAIGTQLAAYGSLLWQIVAPFHLTIDHDWAWVSPAMAISALWLAVIALVASLLRPQSTPTFVLWWCVLCVAPRFVVPLVEGFHEHHLYLPMAGISLALGSRSLQS